MAARHEIRRDDVMALPDYVKIRSEKRKEMAARKKNRRVDVGPHVTFYFENFDTMWLQVHEMLYIERGGEEQIADELEAYNPLVPKGRELVATFMIEIDDPVRRKTVLGRLGGVEETAFIMVNGEKIPALPEEDQDRTTSEGKASSVQFVHFPLNDAQAETAKKPGAQIIVGLGHENYNHMAVLPEHVRAELAGDLD
ncbi:MAG: DUF3501 family protein [Beijerinckiaceae bacterium]